MSLPVGREQVGWLIDFHLGLIRPTRRIPTCHPDGSVRQKQSHRVIQSRKAIRPSGRKSVGDRIVQICIQTRRTILFIIQRSAQRQYAPGWQQNRTHFDPRLGHARSKLPRGRLLRQIDNLGRRRRGISAAHNHHARRIVVRRRQWQQHRTSVSPASAVFRLRVILAPDLRGWIEHR